MSGPEQTSAALLALVVRAVQRRYPELLPVGLQAPDAVRHAKVPAQLKTNLLEHVYAKGGAEVLIDLLADLHEAGFVPMLTVLLAAPTPQSMLHRWLRLERYGHTRHRVKLLHDDEGEVRIARYALHGPPPTRVHDLLILGLLIHLLIASGAQGVRADVAGVEVFADGRAVPGAMASDTGTDLWRLRWQGVGARPGGAQPVGRALALQRSSPSAPLVDAALEHLAADLLRVWTVSRLAHTLTVSPRTLQRRFREAELSFSQAVRGLRVKAACELLADRSFSVTEVGFACGFADSAHFARDFKRSTGASPSQYRTELG